MAQLKRTHEETPRWARLSVGFLDLVLLGLVVTVVVFTNTVKGYAEQNRNSAVAACLRTNEDRVANVRNLANDIYRLRAQVKEIDADIAGIKKYLPQASTWLLAKRQSRAAQLAGIHFKREVIRDKLAAVAASAVRPGSPVVDCERAYPPV